MSINHTINHRMSSFQASGFESCQLKSSAVTKTWLWTIIPHLYRPISDSWYWKKVPTILNSVHGPRTRALDTKPALKTLNFVIYLNPSNTKYLTGIGHRRAWDMKNTALGHDKTALGHRPPLDMKINIMIKSRNNSYGRTTNIKIDRFELAYNCTMKWSIHYVVLLFSHPLSVK